MDSCTNQPYNMASKSIPILMMAKCRAGFQRSDEEDFVGFTLHVNALMGAKRQAGWVV